MKAYEIVTDVLKLLKKEAKAGVSTKRLDEMAEKRVLALGGTPYNKGYKPSWANSAFPAVICTSINDEICHGIPSDTKILQEGDLLSIDIGVKKDGECGDGALTIGIGNISNKDQRLLYYARKTLEEGVGQVKAGVSVQDISRIMGQFAVTRGYVVNRRFGGHGIGEEMHEQPFIFNEYMPEIKDYILKEGQMICLEPLLTYKDRYGVIDKDEWTFRTIDGKKSAFFEQQLRVTKDGCDILTKHLDE